MRSATAATYRITAAVLAIGALTFVLVSPARAASTFYIQGGGNGHGIGLSQYGAYGYALHGKSYRWILAHYYRGTSIGTTNPPRTVTVLLSAGSAAFSGATKAGAKKLNAGETYVVAPNADGTLTLAPVGGGKKITELAAPLTVSGPGPLDLAGMGRYRGSLEFRPDGSGGIETVNVIGLEDYVRGVIAAEMPSGWATQALDAQAVAARTYAITSDAGGTAFDLYADTRSQMYGGVAAETPATDAAVAATRGQIATYHGAPVVTYFFSSSGGHTEDVENVWPGSTPEPWLRGVVDRYDGAGGDPYHSWSYELSLSATAAKLGSWVKGNLIGIRVTKHGVSPRIITAEVVGTKGTTTVTGSELQHAFGLLSTWASFTTISTAPGRTTAAGKSTGERRPVSAQARAVMALVPLVDELVGAVAGLHGNVFPAPAHGKVTIELRTRHGWRTVMHARVGARGVYDTALPGPGTYRISYGSLTGPSVTVL